VLAPIVAGGFAWFSFGPTVLALSGADAPARVLALRFGLSAWLVADVASTLARAPCELASVRYPRISGVANHLGAIALGILATVAHPSPEVLGALVTALSGIAGLHDSAKVEARMEPRWRWLLIGFVIPSFVAFAAGMIGSGILAGGMNILLLYMMCFWIPLASSVALFVTQSSTT
jgi:hypothetical protein